MSVQPPTRADLQSIAESFHLHLDDTAMATMEALVAGALASYEAVDALAETDRPSAPHAQLRHPHPEDNPLNAWYVTAEITGSDTGALAGKRVAVKDNVMVAGLPMMNGSRSLEGFVPVEDATVVDAGPGRRRHRRRQVRLRGPLLLRRQPHRGQRARAQPLGQPAVPRAGRAPAAPPWSRPARSTWPSGATRAARSACRPRGAASSGSSPRTAWSPTPVPSRSRRRSTTSARWRAPSATRPRC